MNAEVRSQNAGVNERKQTGFTSAFCTLRSDFIFLISSSKWSHK
jgi:hypothetical protein